MTNQRNVKSEESQPTDGHERGKDFLSVSELDRLLSAAKKSRHGSRNYLLLLMLYRHGLRVSEIIRLQLVDLNLRQSRIWIQRLKNGL